MKYKVSLGIGFANANRTEVVDTKELGYSDEEWEALPQEEKDYELEEFWKDWSNNYIDGGWEAVE